MMRSNSDNPNPSDTDEELSSDSSFDIDSALEPVPAGLWGALERHGGPPDAEMNLVDALGDGGAEQLANAFFAHQMAPLIAAAAAPAAPIAAPHIPAEAPHVGGIFAPAAANPAENQAQHAPNLGYEGDNEEGEDPSVGPNTP
ncbi:MAG: hypothetical protein P1U63_06685 [Coxiellaceae bacterium]|nr:hypothetical protein [Coxiellaceae bacterium]